MRGLLLGLVLLALLPAQAAALGVRSVVTDSVGTMFSDGSSLGWPVAGGMRRLDVRTGAIFTVVAPPGCELSGIARGGAVLWGCSQVGTIVNDRAIIRAPAGEQPFTAPSIGDDRGRYTALGRAWAEFIVEPWHADTFRAYVNRTTGEVRRDIGDRSRALDLDSSALTPRLCSGMKRPIARVGSYTGAAGTGPLAVADRSALAISLQRVELQRCGRTPRTLQRCPHPLYCSQPVLDGRTAAWLRMDPTSGNVRVTRHRLRTGRTRSVLLSAQSPMLQLVRGRLFISSSTGLFEIT